MTESSSDPRTDRVWRQWLSSMASDPEAALAAAIAYRDLDARGRESWLRSLESDAPLVDAPMFALYAPLLAVETDPERRHRLLAALGGNTDARSGRRRRGLVGQATNAGRTVRILVLVLPLYLDFVEVLACAVSDGSFEWVRHDPILRYAEAPLHKSVLEGVVLEDSPDKAVIDELAVAVLSHRRKGLEMPEALTVLTELFGEIGP